MSRFKPFDTEPVPERALLVGVEYGRREWSLEDSMAELARLAETDGAEVVATLTQRLDTPSSKTFIGKGILMWLSLMTSFLHLSNQILRK